MVPSNSTSLNICRPLSLWLLFLLIFAVTPVVGAAEHYFRFQIESKAELDWLTRIISIDNVQADTVFAYANDDQFARFGELAYDYLELPHPGTLIKPAMTSARSAMLEWDSYPTYETYVDMMYQFAADYPQICRTERFGYSEEGRELLMVKISDNVDEPEVEPEFMYSSTMHGDETTGYVLMLRLIDYLLSNYGTDAQVTAIVDSMEIWINPLFNPDGTYSAGNHTVSGATRGNANGVDLNRNFPDPDDGPHPDGHAWQAETMAMMDFAESHRCILAANFHGGAEVVSYPWDTWVHLHADNNWYISLSRDYADSAQAYSPANYMTQLDDGITNGYDWYPIVGSRQDFMNYYQGCREVTIELSRVKLLPADQLPAHWDYNRVALLEYLDNARTGIRGVVTDSVTGDPLTAAISVVNHDIDSSEVFTDPAVGDYYRLIEAGTFDLVFTSPDYMPDTVENVQVVDGSAVMVNVALRTVTIEPPCCVGIRGNVDNDPLDTTDISDLTALVSYLFGGATPPICPEEANIDGDDGEMVDISDLTYLADYMFAGGPPPPACP